MNSDDNNVSENTETYDDMYVNLKKNKKTRDCHLVYTLA